jgi:hypothetical protein
VRDAPLNGGPLAGITSAFLMKKQRGKLEPKEVMAAMGCLVILVGFAALMVLAVMHDRCVGPFLESSNNQQCVEKRFESVIPRFAAMVDSEQRLGSSYLKGRAILVDRFQASVEW